ncbi:hypothetical protein BsWGS_17781 [Bradybaena similaris]
MEFSSVVSFLLTIAQCIIIQGRATVIPRSNPCISFTSCTSPVTIPTTRIMTALFSLNFFRFADDEFLSEVCEELEEKSSCETFLHQCRNEEWPETADFQNSDFELSLWVCANKARFEANAGCWEDPFLTEMSSCTGIERFLQPTECLTDKIQDLQSCSSQAK